MPVRAKCAKCGCDFSSSPSAKRRFCSTFCAGSAPRPIANRFWEKVNRHGPIPKHRPELGPCWMWLGARHPKGYGDFRRAAGRPTERAHRIAWELTFGSRPSMMVLHQCDNPPCVRTSHLFLGTAFDNTTDMMAKGRGFAPSGDRNGTRLHPETRPRGEQVSSSRLTETNVRSIRAAAADGASHVDQAVKFGVAPQTIGAIVARRKWRHVS